MSGNDLWKTLIRSPTRIQVTRCSVSGGARGGKRRDDTFVAKTSGGREGGRGDEPHWKRRRPNERFGENGFLLVSRARGNDGNDKRQSVDGAAARTRGRSGRVRRGYRAGRGRNILIAGRAIGGKRGVARTHARNRRRRTYRGFVSLSRDTRYTRNIIRIHLYI